MLTYNYHTHTPRCGHATDEPEEYVIRAVENGIKYMGFSDHFPLMFPDGTQSRYRVKVDEAREYCDEIKELGKKYSSRIKIYTGFEMEYYPSLFDKMLNDARAYGGEYLILGQHYSAPENTPVKHSTIATDSHDALMAYVTSVVEAIKTGVFSFVAHPDIFNFTGDEKFYCEQMQKICRASRQYSVPLEINFLGIRQARNYPKEIFWRIAGEQKSPVVFGFDAHDAQNAYDGESLKIAKKMVKKLGLNLIKNPKVILI